MLSDSDAPCKLLVHRGDGRSVHTTRAGKDALPARQGTIGPQVRDGSAEAALYGVHVATKLVVFPTKRAVSVVWETTAAPLMLWISPCHRALGAQSFLESTKEAPPAQSMTLQERFQLSGRGGITPRELVTCTPSLKE